MTSQDVQRSSTTGSGPVTPPGPPRPVGVPHPGPYVPGPRPPMPTGPHGVLPGAYPYGWDPAADEDDPRPAGNGLAALSVIVGLLGLVVSLRPLAFGSMAMSWDTYVALAVAVVGLVLGGVALRTPVRRPVAVVGMVVSVVALLVVGILPTI